MDPLLYSRATLEILSTWKKGHSGITVDTVVVPIPAL